MGLSWTDNAENEVGFRIERATGDGAFAELGTTAANVTAFVDSTVVAERVYNYRVLAFNAAGESTFANSAEVAVFADSINLAPTIGVTGDQEIFAGDSLAALSLAIADQETPAGQLMVSVASSNAAVVPLRGITLGGSGGNRTLTLIPAAGATGFSTMTVMVNDGILTTSRSFRVTVNAVNQPPTISAIGNRLLGSGATTGSISFQVDDDGTAADNLQVSATSSNTALVSANGIVLAGSGANRSITVTPLGGRTGITTITVTASDGAIASSATFSVTVTTPMGLAQAPTISPISSVSVAAHAAVDPVSFSVSSLGLAPEQLTVTGTSSNQALLPDGNITISGTGSLRTLALAPVAGQSGTVTITLNVSDGTTTTSKTFSFAVGVELPPPSRLLNVSTRVMCRPTRESLIPGFVVSGTENKRVLLRAVGPTMAKAPFRLSGVLPNPRLVLKRWNGTDFVDYASNDDWGSSTNVAEIQQATAEVFAFELAADSLDAAMLVDLEPGSYTVVIDDPSGAEGVVIVEIYDAEIEDGGSSVINMSNRGFAGVGEQVMISGFVVSSETPMSVLIRAVGPALAAAPYNVPNMISNPMFEIYRSNQDGTDTLVATQDDWGTDSRAAEAELAADQVSAFRLPAGSRDAAMVTTLEEGVYTVVVRGADNSTGSALVEIYAVE